MTQWFRQLLKCPIGMGVVEGGLAKRDFRWGADQAVGGGAEGTGQSESRPTSISDGGSGVVKGEFQQAGGGGLGVGRRGPRQRMRRNGGIEGKWRRGWDGGAGCGVDRCGAVGGPCRGFVEQGSFFGGARRLFGADAIGEEKDRRKGIGRVRNAMPG